MHKADKNRRWKFVAFISIIIAAIGLTVGPAVAAAINGHTIQDGTVRSREIANGAEGVKSVDVTNESLQGVDLAPDTVGEDKLTPAVRDKLNASDPDLRHETMALEPMTVVNVGGTFGKFTDTVRATQLGHFTLFPGTYEIAADGFFVTNSADANRDVRMQLALRVDDGSDWGLDYGTAFTGQLSPLANREATTSSTRVVEVTEETDVKVLGFGYEDDQGAGASGQVSAAAYITVDQIS